MSAWLGSSMRACWNSFSAFSSLPSWVMWRAARSDVRASASLTSLSGTFRRLGRCTKTSATPSSVTSRSPLSGRKFGRRRAPADSCVLPRYGLSSRCVGTNC
uniref:Uncharacterized protein n=1 Tax=Ixodes ricinus TaxID=34613 RepID=A0A6B0UCC8_IXORI